MDLENVKSLALSGDRIKAIQVLLKEGGLDLREAKEYVDAIASGTPPPDRILSKLGSLGMATSSPAGGAVYKVIGVDGELEVFDDKLTITPKGVLGFLNKGLKGTKTIPFTSITAVQHKTPGFTNGYLQFTLAGGNEGRGGVFEAVKDENSFVFAKSASAVIEQVKAFIEDRRQQATGRVAVAPDGIASELSKLADLRQRGLLSDDEFAKAKERLLKD